MESILDSTKKVLGLDETYDAFDQDIITHINATFSVLNQMGVGPEDGFFISDDTAIWSEVGLPDNQLHLVKTYMYLKVRFIFDPPATSFHMTAMKDQIDQYEWRLNMFREVALPPVTVPEEDDDW
jgi:hypothetical protein